MGPGALNFFDAIEVPSEAPESKTGPGPAYATPVQSPAHNFAFSGPVSQPSQAVGVSSQQVSQMMTALGKPQFQPAPAVTASASTSPSLTSPVHHATPFSQPHYFGIPSYYAPLALLSPQAPAASPTPPTIPAKPVPPKGVSPLTRGKMLETRAMELYLQPKSQFSNSDYKFSTILKKLRFKILSSITTNSVHTTAVGDRALENKLNIEAQPLHRDTIRNGLLGRLLTGKEEATLEGTTVRRTLLESFYSYRIEAEVYAWPVDRWLDDDKLYDARALTRDYKMSANLEALVKYYVRKWKLVLTESQGGEPVGFNEVILANTIVYLINQKVMQFLAIDQGKVPSSGLPN